MEMYRRISSAIKPYLQELMGHLQESMRHLQESMGYLQESMGDLQESNPLIDQVVTLEEHLDRDLEIMGAERAFADLRNEYFWFKMQVNRWIPDFFEVPTTSFKSLNLIRDDQAYESMLRTESLDLYNEKVAYLADMRKMYANLQAICEDLALASSSFWWTAAMYVVPIGLFLAALTYAGPTIWKAMGYAMDAIVPPEFFLAFNYVKGRVAGWMPDRMQQYYQRVKQAYQMRKMVATLPEGAIPLADILKDPEMPNAVVLRAILMLINHLDRLHRAGEVSGLVTLPNVFVKLTEKNEVEDLKLIAFYKPRDAPEVIGDWNRTAAADIYALGELVKHCFILNKSGFVLPATLYRLHKDAMKPNPKNRPTAAAARKYVTDALRHWRNPRRRMR